ncbi:MAG: hypothetical protein K5988_02525 [Lachnospiraceae bacterium]|nr:hypothetical protein [Lachnospiraceae bacterium]
MKQTYSKNKKIYLICFLAAAFIYYFIWSILKPYNYGPDEYVRFPAYYYLYINNCLPTGWTEEIRNEFWGFSYAFYYTWLPGIFSVICMKIVSLFSSSSSLLLYAARFPSVVAGVFSVFLTFRINDTILKDEKTKWFVTFFVASIPQFAFLSSYVNNDIFAVAGSLLIVLSWVKSAKNKLNLTNSLLLALGITVTALSYYNSYGWILFSALFIIILYAYRKNERKNILKFTILIAAIVILLTGFFVVRNSIINSGDIFGLKSLAESSQMYAADHLKPSARDTFKSRGLPLFSLLSDKDYVFSTERSFFAAFAYTDVLAPYFVYMIYRYVTVLGIVSFAAALIIGLFKKEERNFLITTIIPMILSAASVIFLSLYYSWGTDYEPQGRYLYPALPALVVALSLGYELIFNIKKIPKAIGISVSVILSFILWAVSLYCFVFVYVPSDFALADMSNLEAFINSFP